MFVCSYFVKQTALFWPFFTVFDSFFSRFLERSEVMPAVPDHVQAGGEHAAEVRC
jgi:hypothetical protein